MKNSLNFVALDLETTGLNPETDTIIEIAAVKFCLHFDGERLEIHNPIERTMLINPSIPLSEEISLITNITDAMLAGKSRWSDVQQKIADFIPNDGVILGHNVAFDIAMLKMHGIDLTNHKIIDTFEISEIFSQKSQSLNLGFLADFYHISKRGAEHRALTDTWIAVDLFVAFLQQINSLPAVQKAIWEKYALHPHSPIAFLNIFFKKNITENENLENFYKNLQTLTLQTKKSSIFSDENIQNNFEVFSLEADNSENIEQKFLQKMHQQFGNIEIICNSKKSAELCLENLKKCHIDACIESEKYHFVSADSLFDEIHNQDTSHRKYYIFLLKMLFWLTETKTWLLSELKYYGNEFDWLEKFRLQDDESNIFWENSENITKNIAVSVKVLQKNFCQNSLRKTIFRDIALSENTIRKTLSHSISFEKLLANISLFPHHQPLSDAVRMVEALYAHAANRPTGENPIPPWKYGETYFLPQQELWCRSGKWLSMATALLKKEWKQFEKNTPRHSRFEKIHFQKITTDIASLFSFHIAKNPDIWVIITIINDEICVQFIDKHITQKSTNFFQNSIGYGFDICSENMKLFFKNEFPSPQHIQIFWKKWLQITCFESIKTALKWEKILILTTSMKHIREIGNSLDKNEFHIFMQWISGGKSKMTHYFLKNSEKKSVLIGLIDTFREESAILESVDTVIIAKIPFDPPSDPHFLAKTSGMSNSFEIYSKPVVLSKLNSLIGNIKMMNANAKIVCTDYRIHNTEWGKFVGKNLL